MERYSGVISLILRLLITVSVFDIYFKSPLIQVPEPSQLKFKAPAERVVIFVADGLRARSFYVPNAAPYLHNVGKDKGVLGISHTQVPTESRPGHVALLAGFYEDPSAITKGWSENPVEFDSVLNRSRNSWSWGSPDILNMFNKDNLKDNINIHTYGAELEDFSSKDSSYLDTWVFHRVEEFFLKAVSNNEVKSKLNQKGNIFFLHLLGCDTNGHTNKPESYEYKQNIKVVDNGIKHTVDLIEDYFQNDNKTVFIFTADHGMTNWGSHGTGMDDETLTPFVAWGAGVKTLRHHLTNTEIYSLLQDFDEFSGSLYKVDLAQADITPLISILLGNNIPTNSIGMMPYTLLDLHPKQLSQALKIQLDHLLAQYTKLLQDHESFYLPQIFHQSFPDMTRKRIVECETIIQHKINFGHYNESIKFNMECINKAYHGITYYQRYQKTILKILISLTLVCSILADLFLVNSLLSSFRSYSSVGESKKLNIMNLVQISTFCFLVISWFCQKLPFHFLFYYLAPSFTFHRMKRNWSNSSNKLSVDFDLIKLIVLALIICEIIVFAFFDRRILTLGVGLIMIFFSNKRVMLYVLFLMMGLFSWLPPIDGRQQVTELVLVVAVITSSIIYFKLKSSQHTKLRIFLMVNNIASGVCVFYTSKVSGLNPVVQIIVWIIFLTSLPAVLIMAKDTKTRVLGVLFSLQAIYTLLSLSYEALFLFILSLFIMEWINEETSSSNTRVSSDIINSLNKRQDDQNYRDDILSFIRFFFLVFYSFFATGNIASLNSFDPGSIRCFVAVFNPFLMGGLLLIKVLIPLIMLGVVYAYIAQVNRIKPALLQSLLQLFSDFLSIHFFFLVRDSGSWLDIGSSLSHFIIVEGTSLALGLLLHASKLLVNTTLTKLSSD